MAGADHSLPGGLWPRALPPLVAAGHLCVTARSCVLLMMACSSPAGTWQCEAWRVLLSLCPNHGEQYPQPVQPPSYLQPPPCLHPLPACSPLPAVPRRSRFPLRPRPRCLAAPWAPWVPWADPGAASRAAAGRGGCCSVRAGRAGERERILPGCGSPVLIPGGGDRCGALHQPGPGPGPPGCT